MSKDTTRERILAAASEVFAVKGFDKTTVRDICAKADVNVAAVNYHYGDKQNLYFQVLSSWMDEYVEKTGLRESMANDETPEKQLREYIKAELSYMCRAYDPEGIQLNKARQIMQELMADDHNPEVFDCQREIEQKILFPTIKKLIGDRDDPEILNHAAMSATSLTIHYFLRAIDNPDMAIQTTEDLEFTADFLTSFALGGLKSIKEKYNA